jgi:adenylosuccinate lyase
MRRLFWLGVGLALGALVFRKLNQTAQRLAPRSMAQSAGSALAELTQAVQDFSAEVRDSMREREVELREGAAWTQVTPRRLDCREGRRPGEIR